MAKVELLKQVGDHKKGTILEINDKAVLTKWEELGVINTSKKSAEKVEKQPKQ